MTRATGHSKHQGTLTVGDVPGEVGDAAACGVVHDLERCRDRQVSVLKDAGPPAVAGLERQAAAITQIHLTDSLRGTCGATIASSECLSGSIVPGIAHRIKRRAGF